MFEAITGLVQQWPFIGFCTFIIFVSLLSVRYDGALKFDNNMTLMLISYMLLGPISIPIAFLTFKELP